MLLNIILKTILRKEVKAMAVIYAKVIVIVPILSEGIVVEKTQYVSREKRRREKYNVWYADG